MHIQRRLFIAVALLILSATAESFAARGDITLLGQLYPPGAVSITDVTGYYDSVTGKEYAVVGDWNRGVYVIDVTDPTAPTVAAPIVGRGGSGFDVQVWGHYIYTCGSSPSGVLSRVINIADLTNPIVGQPFQSAHNFSISPDGYLFAELFGLRVYDLNPDPMLPTLKWSDGFGDAHDSVPIGNRLYDFRGGYGTYIWDISNRATPAQLGLIFDPAIKYNHSGYPTEDGNYLFICDELAKGSDADISVWDIQNPASATRVAEWKDTTATVHNLYIVGTLAFVSYYRSGFRVFDVSNPAAPAMLGEFDTSPDSGDGYAGCFGVYAFAPSGNIYASDMSNGLYIFGVDRGVQTPVTFSRMRATAESDGSVVVEWEVVADEPITAFRVYRRVDGSAWNLQAAAIPPGERRYVDRTLPPGSRAEYRVTALLGDDREASSTTAVIELPLRATRLIGNHPNPFNPSTVITYEVGDNSLVSLTIFDARGATIRTLVRGTVGPGLHEAPWDGTDEGGRSVASGVYFSRLSAGGRSFTKQLVLLK